MGKHADRLCTAAQRTMWAACAGQANTQSHSVMSHAWCSSAQAGCSFPRSLSEKPVQSHDGLPRRPSPQPVVSHILLRGGLAGRHVRQKHQAEDTAQAHGLLQALQQSHLSRCTVQRVDVGKSLRPSQHSCSAHTNTMQHRAKSAAQHRSRELSLTIGGNCSVIAWHQTC